MITQKCWLNSHSRSGSQIVNDILADLGEITDEKQDLVLYKQKVVRMRKKARTDQVENKKGRSPIALMFDERKDFTKKAANGTKRFETLKEEHC